MAAIASTCHEVPHSKSAPPGLGAETEAQAALRRALLLEQAQLQAAIAWQTSTLAVWNASFASQLSAPGAFGCELAAGRARLRSSTTTGTAVSLSDDDTEEHRTTVLLKDMPKHLSRDSLLLLLDEQGFERAYDFVYVPHNYRRGESIGYAFVNWIHHCSASKFMSKFPSFAPYDGEKLAQVTWAESLQGLDAHVERYRNSPTMHASVPDAYKPAIFKDGARVPFPEPTRPVKAPRGSR